MSLGTPESGLDGRMRSSNEETGDNKCIRAHLKDNHLAQLFSTAAEMQPEDWHQKGLHHNCINITLTQKPFNCHSVGNRHQDLDEINVLFQCIIHVQHCSLDVCVLPVLMANARELKINVSS